MRRFNMIIATYIDLEKSGVTCTGDFNGSIPRSHRFWHEYGIDVLEQEGKILPYLEHVIPEPVLPTEAELRQKEMEVELTWAMIQREYHLTNDIKRMRIARDVLDKYSIACRDHVQEINGVLKIVGEKPVRPEQGVAFTK